MLYNLKVAKASLNESGINQSVKCSAQFHLPFVRPSSVSFRLCIHWDDDTGVMSSPTHAQFTTD